MEVVETCDALPCNAEVLQFLKERRDKLKKKDREKEQLVGKGATVVLEALNYLESTPAGPLSEELSSEKLNEFCKSIEKFNLKPAEQLQILNHCPKSAVEIQLLVEDSEERLSDTDVDEILIAVKVKSLNCLLPFDKFFSPFCNFSTIYEYIHIKKKKLKSLSVS